MQKSVKYFRNFPPFPPLFETLSRAYTIYHYTDIRYIRRFVKNAQKHRAEIVQNAENAENCKKGVDRRAAL